MATITDDLAKAVTEGFRQAQIDIANQDKLLVGPGDVTLTRADGTTFTGPSLPKMAGLTNSALQWRGNLPANANLNTYGPTSAFTGTWSRTATSNTTAAYNFPEDAAPGIFEVMAGGLQGCTQRYTTGSGNVYTRSLTAAWNGTDGPWGAWQLAGVNTRPGYFSGDMNNLITPGNWSIASDATNAPMSAETSPPSGICEVIPRTNTGAILQRYTVINNTAAIRNRTWQRTLFGTVWTPWELLGTKALNDLGLGLVAVQTLVSFDWQQADLLSGAIYYVSSTNITNMPSGITYTAGTGLYIIVRGNAQSGARNTIQVIPDSIPNSNYRVYDILSVGAKGARTFTVRQLFTTADIIPISYGGTGATTQAAALTALLGSSSVPVANGGTGAKDAAGARQAIGAARGGAVLTGGYANIYNVEGGLYSVSAGNFSDPGNGDYGALISCGVYGSGVNGQIFIRNDGSSLLYRGGSNATVRKVYTDANTTTAADGSLKAASPIVKVFADGSYATNDESEGVTVTRQAEGVYLITGCIGLNADASWGGVDGGFDIPKDRNRQPLIWLDYEVNPDGSVLVKTYHRTHPGAPAFARNEREGVSEGDPIDIPADQFVSVRVEMPEDCIFNQRKAEAERIYAEQEEARRIAEEEEAARVMAEQERLEAGADPEEHPDVQQ